MTRIIQQEKSRESSFQEKSEQEKFMVVSPAGRRESSENRQTVCLFLSDFLTLPLSFRR